MRQRREAGGGQLVAVVAVLALAVGLRVIALRWGLPDETHLFSYHPDEYHSLRGMLSLAAGDPNPHFFNYGSLYLYLVAAACVLRHPGYVLADDLWAAGGPGLPAALRDWTLDARMVTVALGTLTVLVMYMLARRIWGHRAGLIAALTLAVMPLHVVHSHYATVDVPMTFFITLTLLLSVRALEEPSWRNFAWAGAAAGLAASVKYSGIVCLVAPATVWVMLLARTRRRKTATAKANGTAVGGEGTPRHERMMAWLVPIVLVVAAVVAFAVTSPFTFLDWDNAWRDIRFEMQHMRLGDDPWALSAEPCGWLFHLKQLAFGGGWLFLFAGVLGVDPGKIEWKLVPLLVFGVVLFAVIGNASVRYARYEVALAPVIAVAAAWVGASGHLGRRRRVVPGVIVAVGIAAALVTSVVYLHGMATAQPRARALAAIEAYVPPDAMLGIVSHPWFHAPPVDYCNGGGVLRHNPVWRQYQRPVRELIFIGLGARALRKQAPEAFLLTGFDVDRRLQGDDPAAKEFIAALEAEYERVWEIDAGRYVSMFFPTERELVSRAEPAMRIKVPFCWQPAQDWLYPFPRFELWVRTAERL